MKNNKENKKNKDTEKAPKKGLGKSAKTLIISVAGVAVLVGIFLLVYFMLPQQEDPKDPANMASVEENSSNESTAAEYTLVSHVPADIEKIEVENEHGKYTLLSETPIHEMTASDGTTSTVTDSTIYTLVGYEDLTLTPGSPDMVANDAASVSAGKIVNDGSKKSDFGFDSPRATVKTTFRGGDVTTIIVGDDAPDNRGTYIMIEGDDNVYLVNTDMADGFLIGAMNMISNEIGSAAEDESGNVFTKMVFGGTLFGSDVEFTYANSENFSETYRIVSPDNVLANEEVVTYMINNIRSLTAEEVVAVNAEENKIKELGLSEPYVTVKAEYPDLKVDYKASKPDGEGSFYLLTNGIIYKMSTESVPWVLHDYSDCVVKSILAPKYGSVSGITCEAGGKEYKFDIETETTTSNDGSTDITTTTVKCGGNVIDQSKFDTFYQNLTSAERCGGVEKKPDGKKSILKVTLTYSDGATSEAEFFEGENRKCPVVMDGAFSSLAYENYVTKMIEDLPKISANSDVESIY